MLRKVIYFLLCLVLFLSSNYHFALAQNTSGQGSAPAASGISADDAKMMIAPDYPTSRGSVMPFSGQNHNYSVVFRGNGESIITLRVSLTNTSDKSDLKEITLRIPKVTDPKDLSAYQILVEPPCIRYQAGLVPQTYPYNPKCLEYGEPDYYYYYGGGKYQKANTELSGDTLKITLPTALAPNKTGSFFLYYRGFGYAHKDIFGAYKYDFESLKVNDQINQLTIGISTDADQFLKGSKGEVEYRAEATTSALKMAPVADAGAVANPSIDNFVSQIGQGTIVKTASNLASMESYKVNGSFANSRAKLYGKELATVFGVILFFVLLVLLVLYAIQKRSFKKDKVEAGDHKVMSDDGIKRIGMSAGVSFASALVTAGYSIAVYAIYNALANIVDYQYQSIVMILLVVISFAIYTLVIIGPSVFVGYKKGMGWGIGTFVMTIVWLILMAAVTVAILFVFRDQNNYPPVPLVKSGMSLPQATE